MATGYFAIEISNPVGARKNKEMRLAYRIDSLNEGEERTNITNIFLRVARKCGLILYNYHTDATIWWPQNELFLRGNTYKEFIDFDGLTVHRRVEMKIKYYVETPCSTLRKFDEQELVCKFRWLMRQ